MDSLHSAKKDMPQSLRNPAKTKAASASAALPAWGSRGEQEAWAALPAAIEAQLAHERERDREFRGAPNPVEVAPPKSRLAPLAPRDLATASGLPMEGLFGKSRGWLSGEGPSDADYSEKAIESTRVGLVVALDALRVSAPEQCRKMLAAMDWQDQWSMERLSPFGGIYQEKGSHLEDLAFLGSDELADMALESGAARMQRKTSVYGAADLACLFARNGRAKAMETALSASSFWGPALLSPELQMRPFATENSPLLALAGSRLPLGAQMRCLAPFAEKIAEGAQKNTAMMTMYALGRREKWREINSRRTWKSPKTNLALGVLEDHLGQTLARAIQTGNRAFVSLNAFMGIPQEILDGNVERETSLADIAFNSSAIWALDWLKSQGVELASTRSRDWTEQWGQAWTRWADHIDSTRERGLQALMERNPYSKSQDLYSWQSEMKAGLDLMQMARFVSEGGQKWSLPAGSERHWSQLEAFSIAQQRREIEIQEAQAAPAEKSETRKPARPRL